MCAGSFTMDERMAMIDSLRGATKNTSFERWLETTMQPLQPAPTPSSPTQVVPVKSAFLGHVRRDVHIWDAWNCKFGVW